MRTEIALCVSRLTFWPIENLDQGQKSESAGRYTRSSWNVLRKGQASHSLPGPNSHDSGNLKSLGAPQPSRIQCVTRSGGIDLTQDDPGTGITLVR
jgi:hypothetical protein